jgi:hypothetical protein
MLTKICAACGAELDPIFDYCLFCHNPLPESDFEQLSNEELIARAGVWLGRAKGEKVIVRSTNREGEDIFVELPVNEAWGMAERYIGLLNYRASKNPALQPVVNALEQVHKKTHSWSLFGSTGVMAIAGSAMIAIVYASVFFFLTLDSKLEKQHKTEETRRLTALVSKVDSCLTVGNPKLAEFYANQLVWQAEGGDEEMNWDSFRESALETIRNYQNKEQETWH